LSSGSLFIAERTGLPVRSTMFWVPDQPLRRDCEGKRIRYRYPNPDGGRLLTFVGFQDPVEEILAGTLLRVSLAHWWRPKDRPEEELRCHAQLSGWFLPAKSSSSPSPISINTRQSGLPPAAVPDLDHARRVLKQVFGYADFQSLQADIVARVLQRRDTLAVMPTGGGKSLCYQLPALLLDGLTVVISPLIALMQDQVSHLHQVAVHAAFLNSTLTNVEYVAAADRIRRGEVRILFVAPETLLRPEMLVLLEQSRLACLAVDEAHCISEWGHDFRPEYRQIQNVRRRFPGAVCLALTATATPRVREDIGRLLGIDSDGVFIASFNRPNLFLSVQPRRDGLGQTLAFLDHHRGQSGIIYCSTRSQVDSLAAELRTRDWPALSYHAGLEAEARRRNQDEFIRADAAIMVATIAFGMGINKSNVRFVLHYNMPKDIESYYQEIGRAGRDGLPANCLLLHSRADAFTIRMHISKGATSERAGRSARLDAMVRYADTMDCRREPLLAYFGEADTPRCGHCDNCRTGGQIADLTDVTAAARNFLSCIKDTGECFGLTHITNVLRGSRAQRVLTRSHDQMSVYGSGREFSAEAWRELARQFIEQNLVEQDPQFGGLHLTAQGRAVLKSGKVQARVGPAASPAPVGEIGPRKHDVELFEKLRKLRRELADRAGVPAYVVFSDRALVEMATHPPCTPDQFLAINGVGETKLANYGDAFLQCIRNHTAGRSSSGSAETRSAELDATRWLTVRNRHEEVGEAFAAGRSLDDLARQFSVKRSTILQNLVRFVEQGGKLNPARLLAESRLDLSERERVLSAFDAFGMKPLGPVHEALGDKVVYEELHLLRLWLKCRESVV
jgi:ATP-dependent DNA helicase RecQ